MFESLLTATPYIAAIGVGVIRGIAGYIENVLEGKESFSLGKFFATIFRVFPQALGLSAIAPGSEVGALFTDWSVVKLANAIKNNNKKK
jgi:hypothetical protein